jgi:hypothetical protein
MRTSQTVVADYLAYLYAVLLLPPLLVSAALS